MSAARSDLDRLRAWCGEHRLKLSERQLADLDNYRILLEKWSGRTALVGAADVPLLGRKHLPDCLFAASRCPPRGRAADLGSGAGLPGIPVAIAHPELHVDLVESKAKKVSFLAQATAAIPNAHPLHRRIEDLHGLGYDVALARALAPLDRLLALARPVLRRGGRLLAMKGPSLEAEIARAKPSREGFQLQAAVDYELLDGEQRTLAVLEAA